MIPILIYVFMSVLFGSIFCLFGKKLYFPMLMLTIFSVVAAISFSLFDLTLKAGIITVAVGLISALLTRFFYKLGVFLLGIISGGVLSLFAVSLLPPAAAGYGWIAVLLLTIAAGVCAVKWCDFFIMASTSFNGAFAIAVPICFLVMEFHNLQSFIYADGMLSTMANLNQYLNNQFSVEHGMLLFLVTIPLALGGLVFQADRNRKGRRLPDGDRIYGS